MTPKKLALITGATSGLGLECARALLRSGTVQWSLLIASRNAAEGERVAALLNAEAGRAAVSFKALDLGSTAAIRDFARDLLARGTRLDALVCNAGMQFVSGAARTADGFEATFGINHLGHFLLVQELAPALLPGARIVVVSSGTHDPAQRTGIPAPRYVDPAWLARPELDAGRQFEAGDNPAVSGQRRYSTSKLCNLYFAYELDRRLRSGNSGLAEGITVNAFDPGMMPGTGLARDYGGVQRFFWTHVLPLLTPLLRLVLGNVNTPASSGAALAELVEAAALAGCSGEYFEGRRAIRSSPESYDADRARRLWEVSEQLLGPAAS